MSKIAEQKALEAYPEKTDNVAFITENTFNVSKRIGYIKGYDQAMKDIQEQAKKSVIEKSNGEVTIEDLVAYNQGFKISRELTMQDFLGKAEEFLYLQLNNGSIECGNIEKLIEQFKNYMQNEM